MITSKTNNPFLFPSLFGFSLLAFWLDLEFNIKLKYSCIHLCLVMIYMLPIQKTFEKVYIYKFGRTRLKINEEIVL